MMIKNQIFKFRETARRLAGNPNPIRVRGAKKARFLLREMRERMRVASVASPGALDAADKSPTPDPSPSASVGTGPTGFL
jgi:hypothetical protein